MLSEMKTVAIWKRKLLPGTETFIRNQQDVYSRYRAIAIASQRHDSPLARESDILLHESGNLSDRIKAKILSAFGYSKELSQLLEQKSVDVVHAHFASEAFAVQEICKKLRIPLVVTFHGHDIHTAPEMPGWRGKRYKLRLKSLFKNGQHFIAVSEAIRERAILLGCPPEKITVEYTGIPETSLLRKDDRADYDILFVGRLIPYKGTLHMLKAASIAEEKLGKKLKLAVIGTGPELENLINISRQLNLSVDFLGHQSSSKVQGYLANSKIFCAPSMKVNKTVIEGFGMVYLEAALQETPVVAYAFSGVKEAVAHNETGILVEEGKVDLLADALIRLLRNPEFARQLGINGRQRVLKDFSVMNCIQSIENIYDRLIIDKI